MDAISSRETSENFYWTTRRRNPTYHNPHFPYVPLTGVFNQPLISVLTADPTLPQQDLRGYTHAAWFLAPPTGWWADATSASPSVLQQTDQSINLHSSIFTIRSCVMRSLNGSRVQVTFHETKAHTIWRQAARPEFDSREGRVMSLFSTVSSQALGSTQPSTEMGTIKLTDHTLPSS
jgi:hypothetical protein